jgi:hypothetical protein
MLMLVEAADSRPMIGRLATQKEPTLNSLLFLPPTPRVGVRRSSLVQRFVGQRFQL